MKISKKWLQQHISLDGWTTSEISEMLSLTGTAVESVENPWKGLEDIVVGRIVQAENYPEHPKWKLCSVDIRSSVVQIVCADPEVKKGMHVVVALPGAQLWDGKTIESARFGDVVSQGMMLSLEEMGLELHSNHVFSVPEILEPGTRFCEWLGLDDLVFDLEVTSNRPDELSVLGIAREIHAISSGKRQIVKPRLHYTESAFHTQDHIKISIDEPDLCYRYTGLVIRGVKVDQSPLWLIRNLVAMGLNPINNVVDISNYVLMEMGHPVHAFDLGKIKSGEILVRKAKPGESMQFLDEKARIFHGEELLITDGTAPIALAGVMGGEETAVDFGTEDLLLEVAYFHPVCIRKTSKMHNLSTDASYRFERGVDPNDALIVIKRLAHLIQSVCGGEVAQSILDVHPRPVVPKVLQLRHQRIKKVLGFSFTEKQVSDSLANLGMGIKPHEKNETNPLWIVSVPTFRPDIEREIDLIEEVGRINGYEKIPSKIPRAQESNPGYSEFQDMRYQMRDLMLAQGFHEISPVTMIDPTDLHRFKLNDEHPWQQKKVRLLKPLSEDLSIMRPSTLPTLIRTVSYNYSHQQRHGRFFEMGNVFTQEQEHVQEKEMLGWAVIGKEHPGDYTDNRESHFYTVKGSLEEVFEHLEMDTTVISFQPLRCDLYDPIFYATQSAMIFADDQLIGVCGMVRREITLNYDIKTPLYMGEIDLKALFSSQQLHPRVWRSSPAAYYPSSKKDFSILVSRGTEMGAIIQELRKIRFVESVDVVDIYKGAHIPKDMTSVTLSATLRASDHTLTESELNETIDSIRSLIQSQGLEIREA